MNSAAIEDLQDMMLRQIARADGDELAEKVQHIKNLEALRVRLVAIENGAADFMEYKKRRERRGERKSIVRDVEVLIARLQNDLADLESLRRTLRDTST